MKVKANLKKILTLVLLGSGCIFPQKKYWNQNSLLTPLRLPLPDNGKATYLDLDGDGDPDVLRYTILNGIPVQWIDDDDDMKKGDLEGDTDSDCLMIDRNRDGNYGSQYDLIIDWDDENNDGKADIQAVVDYSGFADRGRWHAHYMWMFDDDGDNILNYIDWNTMQIKAWEHSGCCNFFTDYHGKSLFIKSHTNTFNIKDLRFGWENPFIFYDPDKDGQTEMVIRYVDEPQLKTKLSAVPLNGIIPDSLRSVIYTKRVKSVQMSFDLDNDSRPGNELDFDFSIKLSGKGFDYSDQVHKFKSLRGLPEADKYFYDPRWRRLEELVFTGRKNAYKLPFERGEWNSCWIVYDEDDDCHRWERVEFYDPESPFNIGAHKGGLDNNPQADVTGDRGEWDSDFSGKGQLYIGKFDGKIHLYGAEWGAWRIDQNAKYYQGWQGWRGKNIQPEDLVCKEPTIVPTIRYSDSDGDGFFDTIEEDLDGDKIFETKIELKKLGLQDSSYIIDISRFSYKDWTKLYRKVAEDIWTRALEALEVYKSFGLSDFWYARYLSPKTLRQKYDYGFWLAFYIHKDLLRYAELKNNKTLKLEIDKAYYGNLFKSLLRNEQKIGKGEK